MVSPWVFGVENQQHAFAKCRMIQRYVITNEVYG
jgi:hypothetical protein